MGTKPHMTRLQTNVSIVIEKTAIEKKWSISSTISDILTEVVLNKQIPSYLITK